jgi:hypothetical protein
MENSLTEGIDYIIENGKWVFTKEYHLKRGYCCNNNCKNCPYKKIRNNEVFKRFRNIY